MARHSRRCSDRMSTNRWGMRDRDYERLPAPGVFRMALLGPSNVMGWGVADGETFEAVLRSDEHESLGDARPRLRAPPRAGRVPDGAARSLERDGVGRRRWRDIRGGAPIG